MRVRLALRDLDTGLFFIEGKWTADPLRAQAFPNQEAIEKVALERAIVNAEMVCLKGHPLRVSGGVRIRIST